MAQRLCSILTQRISEQLDTVPVPTNHLIKVTHQLPTCYYCHAVMLVIVMLMTDFRFWWQNHYVGNFFRYVDDFLNVLIRSPTSQTCHQHIWSQTSVTINER